MKRSFFAHSTTLGSFGKYPEDIGLHLLMQHGREEFGFFESNCGDSTKERYSSTDDTVLVAAVAAVAVEEAATAVVEVADPNPLCQSGRGSLTTLPSVVRPTSTQPGQQQLQQQRGGGAAAAKRGGKF